MTTLNRGMKRLLKLADILDTADAEHKRNKDPLYEQGNFVHPCGTPACALGHWAAHNKARWYFSGSGWKYPLLKGASDQYTSISCAATDFGIDTSEALALFQGDGCGNAKTAKQAAKYIRKFVAKKTNMKLSDLPK